MGARSSSTVRARRSSLAAAQPHTARLHWARPGHRNAHGPSPEQLLLALDVPGPGPRLVAEARDGGTVPTVTTHPPARAGLSRAPLGPVAAAVLEFHHAFDLPRAPTPTSHVADVLAQLRVRLLREEVEEFAQATEERDLVAIADALADIIYVAYGSAVTYGIDLDAVVAEVHRSNMSKLDAAGRPVLREDGKVLKSARYRPPEVRDVLADQLPLFDADVIRTRGHASAAG